MLGGGTEGISTLMDAVEKFRQKNGGSLDPKKMEQEMKQFADLKKKMKNGEELTAGDLNMVAGNVYDLMSQTGRDGSDAGMKRARVDQLFRESPALRKMFKDNELSYDSIDTTGAGAGGHAVLGIGHGRKDKDHTGAHSAIYDPYRRTSKNPALKQAAVEAGAKLQQLREDRKRLSNDDEFVRLDARIAFAQAEYDQALKKERDSHENLGQVITDRKSIGMYRTATTESMEMEADGPHTKVLPAAPIPQPTIWDGMY
jgi:hypothetical protein